MRTTLLITTYNWSDALRLVLDSALSQTVLPNEIVIADDGSGDETSELIAEFIASSPIQIKHVWHEDKGFRKTIILNKAIAISSGDYIMQVDGDCILSPHYIEDHQAMATKGYFAGGKRVMLTEEMTYKTIAKGKLAFSRYSLLKTHKGTRQVKTILRLPFLMNYYSRRLSQKRSSWTIAGYSFSFWKENVIDINGYNEKMEGWGFEDIDILSRLGMIGVKHIPIRYGGFVYHLWHPTRDLGIRDEANPNFRLMQEHIRSGTYWVDEGIDKYLK